MRASPALLLVLLLAPAQAAAQSMPKLKAGMWEQTSAMEGMPAAARQPSYVCLDDATQARWSVLGQRLGNCDAMQMQRTPEGLRFTSSCTIGGRRSTTSGVMKGDFNSRYEMTTTTAGAGGKPVVVRAVSRYVGACKGLRPGQMRVMGMVMTMPMR